MVGHVRFTGNTKRMKYKKLNSSEGWRGNTWCGLGPPNLLIVRHLLPYFKF